MEDMNAQGDTLNLPNLYQYKKFYLICTNVKIIQGLEIKTNFDSSFSTERQVVRSNQKCYSK